MKPPVRIVWFCFKETSSTRTIINPLISPAALLLRLPARPLHHQQQQPRKKSPQATRVRGRAGGARRPRQASGSISHVSILKHAGAPACGVQQRGGAPPRRQPLPPRALRPAPRHRQAHQVRACRAPAASAKPISSSVLVSAHVCAAGMSSPSLPFLRHL